MKTGSVVISIAGHDKGCLYVVLGSEDDLLLVCDGKNKTLSSPKKKNIKHLNKTGLYIDLSVYNPLYDAHIRKELKGLNKSTDTVICKK